MKGQVSIIEAILSAVVLFIAFNMMITTGEYQTKWKEALNSLQGRDALITADRLGKLHDYSFSPSFQTDFLNKILVIKDAVVKTETHGTVKNTLYVACDCNNEQSKINYLTNILSDVKFNTRGVTAVVCPTTLPTINNCGASTKYPNALVIWRYDALEEPARGVLIDFVKDGNGLIEITDVQNSKVDGLGNDDEGQKIIFGIKSINEGNFPANPDEFLRPRNSSLFPYQSYKWFYHLPYLLTATATGSIPLEGGGITCAAPSISTTGNFKFQNTDHKFWICDGSSVYFDTNGNNQADFGPLTNGQKFSIGASNFKLNYIDTTDKIRISFKSDYLFNDFVFVNNANNKLAPTDSDKNKVLLSMGFWDPQREKPIATIIFNRIENGKTAWVADFSRDGLSNTGDDHKQLLSSLIFSVANKYSKETFQQVGEITSYINVNNTDMLEIYKIDLSIGAPF